MGWGQPRTPIGTRLGETITEDTEATTTPTPAPKKEKASDSTQARKGK